MFANRQEAGKQLAKKLTFYANRHDVVVLALPRGGVPVAYEIAKELNLPLDVFLVRKLGIPDNEETAMGAIASGGITILDENTIRYLNISQEKIRQVIIKEQAELEHRSQLYHAHSPAINFQNHIVILVDDGIATGATMKAAVIAIKKQGVKKVVIAVPVSSRSAYLNLSKDVNKMVSLITPEIFNAVGNWYTDFPQVHHQEVKKLLSEANNK